MNDPTKRSVTCIPVTCVNFHPKSMGRAADPEYSYHHRTVRVTSCGRICLGRSKIDLTLHLQAIPLAYARSTTRSGWSASWRMIGDTSIKKGTGQIPVPHRSVPTNTMLVNTDRIVGGFAVALVLAFDIKFMLCRLGVGLGEGDALS